jgi:serine/threonine protein phosphatase PrpC
MPEVLTLRFTAYKETRLGARHENEDRVGFAQTSNCHLLVACDGMGGIPRGEVAAQYVLEHLLRSFQLCAKPRLREPAAFLRDSIVAAHNALRLYAGEQAYEPVPCTTCVLALVQDDQVWLAHVGDSRGYVVRDGDVAIRTVDHSYVQHLINEGKISTAQAETHPERHKITNCLGQQRPPFVEVSQPAEIYPSDVVMVCTDGLWGSLSDAYIGQILSHTDIPTGMGCLMDLAESLAGRTCDNISAVAMSGEIEDRYRSGTARASSVQVTDVDVDIALTLIDAASSPRKDQR